MFSWFKKPLTKIEIAEANKKAEDKIKEEINRIIKEDILPFLNRNKSEGSIGITTSNIIKHGNNVIQDYKIDIDIELGDK